MNAATSATPISAGTSATPISAATSAGTISAGTSAAEISATSSFGPSNANSRFVVLTGLVRQVDGRSGPAWPVVSWLVVDGSAHGTPKRRHRLAPGCGHPRPDRVAGGLERRPVLGDPIVPLPVGVGGGGGC